jgi:hypothetical protein
MAGDWMKIELELPDKPEVHSIAASLNLDPDCVVGKLIRVWQWFDKHTTDGNAYGVTYSLLDRITCVTGFGEAMMFVGWMEQNDKFLTMPKFDRHTSRSAKTRALTANRVEKIRGKNVTHQALPREEKSIKEINKEKTQIATRLPATWKPSDSEIEFCKKERPDLDPQTTAACFVDFWIGKPGAGGKKLDWAATWRNWVRAQNRNSKSQNAGKLANGMVL